MVRLPVRSRSGNLLLAILGTLYVVGAIVVLAWFVIDAWLAAGLIDLLLQFALVAAGFCGAWFVANAMGNLGWRDGRHQRRA